MRGKNYATNETIGAYLWEQVKERLQDYAIASQQTEISDAWNVIQSQRYGSEYPFRPRLGQGAFKVAVTDAYQRRCAITGERTLPVLEASHIKPYPLSGPHDVNNGLLLRSDLHILFDQGYLTITETLRVEVSQRIREEFENGRDYYVFDGRSLFVPDRRAEHPSLEHIRWHHQHVFAS